MLSDEELNGQKGLFARTTRQFPKLFSGSYKSNIAKASLWWRNRSEYFALRDGKARPGKLVGFAKNGRLRHNMKSFGGRGRKRTVWAVALHDELLSEFERMRAASVKLSPAVLRHIAISIIHRAPPCSLFARGVVIDGVPITSKISPRWIQNFMHCHNLVVRRQTGKLAVSPEKQLFIERSIAFHLGTMKRCFASGELNEDTIENADETHFVFNMDNGRTVGMRGDEHVKYADVVSGDEGITMMVRVTGGARAAIQTPMLVFKNDNSSYPIRGVPDTVPGVCYRSGKKGWMDGRVFKEWLTEPRAIAALPGGRRRVLYVDNCSGHNTTPGVEEALKGINTELRKLPPNATDLVQPADSFIISKLKDAWRREWDLHKASEIARGAWMGSGSGASGKLRNPGKAFFLKLAAKAVREVNAQRDKNGVSYARKAMIRTGMSLNLNGLWEEKQLSDELQSIVAKHREFFDGKELE